MLALGANIETWRGGDLTVVYADGAVARLAPAQQSTGGSARSALVGAVPMVVPVPGPTDPGRFIAGSLDPCALAEVVERADAIFTARVDFGTPRVDDGWGTSFGYRPEGTGAIVDASAYMFSRTQPEEWDELSNAQNRARSDVAELWAFVDEHTDEHGSLDREVMEVRSNGRIDDDSVDWPLPPPSELFSTTFDCYAVPAEDVPAVLEWLEDQPEDRLEVLLVVRTLPPGYSPCAG